MHIVFYIPYLNQLSSYRMFLQGSKVVQSITAKIDEHRASVSVEAVIFNINLRRAATLYFIVSQVHKVEYRRWSVGKHVGFSTHAN